PISGLFLANASALAALIPTKSAPIKPGPSVTAIASISSHVSSLCSNASSKTIVICSTWCRDAISGTTPPKRLWLSICEETTFEITFVPFLTIATAVSSQLVSIPNMIVSFFMLNSPTLIEHLLHYLCNNFFLRHLRQVQTFGTYFVQQYWTPLLLKKVVPLLIPSDKIQQTQITFRQFYNHDMQDEGQYLLLVHHLTQSINQYILQSLLLFQQQNISHIHYSLIHFYILLLSMVLKKMMHQFPRYL